MPEPHRYLSRQLAANLLVFDVEPPVVRAVREDAHACDLATRVIADRGAGTTQTLQPFGLAWPQPLDAACCAPCGITPELEAAEAASRWRSQRFLNMRGRRRSR